jgi:hypothetical protein
MRNQVDSHKFIPQLYIRNPSWDPPMANAQIETALVHFRHRLIAEQSKFNKYSRPNISCLQNTALCLLPQNKKIIIIWADKNMGSVIMLREQYIKQCIKEHLGNGDDYENITDNIQTEVAKLNESLDKFCKDRHKAIGKFALTFFNRSKAIFRNNIARFRATAKVHKTPIKLRPVVPKVGTSIEAASKWLDVKLQHLMKLLSWCIKDSDSYRCEVIQVYIPPNARLVIPISTWTMQ